MAGEAAVDAAPAPAPAPPAAPKGEAEAEGGSPRAVDGKEGAGAQRPRNRIQVSREKRPLYFFIGLAKKFLMSEDEVELSGLGLAVTTVVTVAEILKNSGYVTISRIATSLVEMPVVERERNGDRGGDRAREGREGHTMAKAKIQIWIQKSDQFDTLVQVVDHKKNRGKNGKHKAEPHPQIGEGTTDTASNADTAVSANAVDAAPAE